MSKRYTLLFLRRGADEVLLGLKKRGFGKGSMAAAGKSLHGD